MWKMRDSGEQAPDFEKRGAARNACLLQSEVLYDTGSGRIFPVFPIGDEQSVFLDCSCAKKRINVSAGNGYI